MDIRDLIDLGDVMDELEFGPNGGLIYCFEWVAMGGTMGLRMKGTDGGVAWVTGTC